MANNISKRSNGSSSFSGSLAKSFLSYGVLTIGYSGSGSSVNIYNEENG